MRTPHARLAALITLIAGCSASAQDAPFADDMINVLTHTPPKVYQGQVVARVHADSMREVAAAMSLAESLWSEGAGVRTPFDIQIHANRLDALREAGLEVELFIPDLQAHADARWAAVQDRERFERRRALERLDQPAQRGANPHDESWFTNFKQLTEIQSYVNGLATARPDLTTIADEGDSIQGRDILSITITGPDQPGNAAADRPVIIWNGCQHAREWISPMTVTYLASRLVGDYDSDPAVKELVDTVRFVVVPVVNPDGYTYSWASERFWRKNRRDNPGASFGVDLNRNWGYEWGGDGASTDSDSDTFRGASAFSEPETQTMQSLALGFGTDLVAHIDYHSYSQLILWPFGYADGVVTPEPDRTFFDTLTNDLSDAISSFSGEFYSPIQSWQLYAASGTSTDWFYGTAGAKSITFELRPSTGGFDGFDPPPSEILPCAQENWEAAKLFAARTTQRLSFAVSAPSTVPSGTPVDLAFTIAPGTEDYDPTSVSVFASIGGGAITEYAAGQNGTGNYTAQLPSLLCGETAEFTVRATTLGGDDVTFPATDSISIDAITVAFDDDMETDTGWIIGAAGDTATTGIWERADPERTDAQPENDHTPTGTECWITEADAGSSVGVNDIDNGATTLTSPTLDATNGSGDAVLSYWRWYSNTAGAAPGFDTLLVQISDDNGGSWSTLEIVDETAGDWVEARFTVSDFVTPTDQVRVRFVASDFDSGSIVEAGVDDLRIEFTGCDNPTSADLAEPFGTLNFFDIAAYIALYNAADPSADLDQNGLLNFFDVSAFIDLYNQGL